MLDLFFRAFDEIQGIFGRFSPGTGTGATVVVVVATVVVVGAAVDVIAVPCN